MSEVERLWGQEMASGEEQAIDQEAPASDEEQAGYGEAQSSEGLEGLDEADVQRLGGAEKARSAYRNLQGEYTRARQEAAQAAQLAQQLAQQNALLSQLAAQNRQQAPQIPPQILAGLLAQQAPPPQPEEKFDPQTWVDQLAAGPDVIDKRAEAKARKLIEQKEAQFLAAQQAQAQQTQAMFAALASQVAPVIQQNQQRQVREGFESQAQALRATFPDFEDHAPVMHQLYQLAQTDKQWEYLGGLPMEAVYHMAKSLRGGTPPEAPDPSGKAAGRLQQGGGGRRMQTPKSPQQTELERLWPELKKT